MSDKRIGTYESAMRQANREAKTTVVALAAIVVVWIVGGFGLMNTGIEIFHTPLWVFGGCVMPWIAAVVAAVVLSRRVFRDFDLDEVACADADGAASDALSEACPENVASCAVRDAMRHTRIAQDREGGR